MNTFLLTFCAMLAFAGNSIFCRYALGFSAIDPLSFTLVRLVSGAAVLAALVVFTDSGRWREKVSQGSWSGGLALFVYALSFSLAYVKLGTAEGALVLFATVQLVTIVASFIAKQKPSVLEVWGLMIALLGVAILLLPNAARPDMLGAILMIVSGGAWAGYTLLGRNGAKPLINTTGNFFRASALALLLLVPLLALWSPPILTGAGLLLAVASGALASAIGYAIWYKCLARLTITQAGVVQLSVPMLAAIGGVLFVGEALSVILMIAMITVLAGIALTLKPKKA
ncbi:DMT family transporter [Gilvimarinus agarilyticus]|uniref:DMT family transporter n=1 Tax=Gilvimarinus sp. 2_MG-2023 TaxID=3062666 RepID=UPI001C09DD8D|nr:DMT family transporter [Gilvimarinus sp. 2_MG-2023]MBU2887088.1 DMT family transporter [Gilvimarinus agarilyticus]MDO6571747.1 DMT family transporter [Gilvimarinus sp. 2_MG-2023]